MKFSIQLLLFIFFQAIHAQEIDYNLYLRHTIRQDNQTYQFKTIESSKMTEIVYDLSKSYYWYKAQLVITTQGSASGVLLHGAFESFYDNKQLSSKGNFSNGLKHGTWMYWNEKGKLIRLEHWKEGKKSGEEIIYDAMGHVLCHTNYKSKKYIQQKGDTLIESSYDGKNKLIVLRDTTGKIFRTEKYKNGILVPEKVKKEKANKAKETKTSREEIKDNRQPSKEKKSIWKLFQKREKSSHPLKKEKKRFQLPEKKQSRWKFWKKPVNQGN